MLPARLSAQSIESEPTSEPTTAPASQPASQPATEPAAAQAPAVESPIPLAEIANRASDTIASLRRTRSSVDAMSSVTQISNDLPAMTTDINARYGETEKIVYVSPPIETLQSLEQNWIGVAKTIDAWRDELTARANQLESNVRDLASQQQVWKQVETAAEANGAPAETVSRVNEVNAQIALAITAVEKRRAQVLSLQTRVSEQAGRVSDARNMVEQAQSVALSRLLDQDAPPIWSSRAVPANRDVILQASRESFSDQRTMLESYASRQKIRFLVHAIVFVLLALLLRWAKKHVDEWSMTEPNLKRTALIFSVPFATAALIAAFCSAWIYPHAPRLLWSIIGAAGLVPAVIVLRKLLEPRLRVVLNALVVFYFIDQARRVTASQQLFVRWLFVLEMLGAALFILWFIRSGRLDAVLKPKTNRTATLTRLLVRGAFILFAVAFVANVFGFVGLSDLLGHATLASAYVGVIFYALTRVLDGLLMVALRSYPLANFKSIRDSRQIIWQRMRWVMHLGMLALWALITLEVFSIQSVTVDFIRSVFDAQLRIGSLRFSLGSILAFLITLYAAVLISRFARFILEEDVYPRVHLERGLPYAISTLLHYAILIGGFILAIAAMGYDMTKFTILAGAFGVGLGFGMQNIVNNFVSGLILLFERPIQIGDTVEIDNVVGTITRIGIRASVIRTVNGSAVIYPNATLISNRVTNWTLSSRKRRIDIPVSVVHGSDPKRVIELLCSVAAAHELIEKKPEPEAVLVNIMPGMLNFELRAWTEKPDQWVKIRSDLAVGMNDVLTQNGITIK